MLISTLSQRGRRVLLLPILVAFFAWMLGAQVEARPGGGQTYRSSSSTRSSSSSGSSRSYSSGSSRSYSGSSSSSSSRSTSSGSSSSSYGGSSGYSGGSSTVYVPSSSSSGSGCNGFTWVVLILIVGVLLYLYLRGRKGGSGPVERATIDVDSKLAQDGIRALQQRDESFDPPTFVDRSKAVVAKVNEAWLGGHMGPVRRMISDGVFTRFNTQLGLLKADGLRNVMSDWRVVSADILAAEADDMWDTVHVRIVGAARDTNVQLGTPDDKVQRTLRSQKLDQYHEVWSFIRRRGKKSKKGVPALEGQCPSCGAQLPTGDVVKCDYCQALVNSGEHDWVLAEITQPEEWRAGAALDDLPGLDGLRARDATISRQELEDRASVIFWKWIEARSSGKPEKLARFCMKDPADASVAAALMLKSAKLRDVAVGSAELKSLDPVEDHQKRTFDRAVVEIRWSASVDGQEPAFDVHEFELSRAADAPQHAKFKRGLCSLDCPSCGGQLSTSDAVTCTYCGNKLSGGKQDWALLAVRQGEVPPDSEDEDDGSDEPAASNLETGLAISAIVAGAALGALSDSSDDD